jgi:predicted choloylglycine hydrolase
LSYKGPLRVLVLKGTPYERGFEHGRALKKEIHELVKLWKTDIEKSYKMDANTFIAKFLKRTNFQKAIKRWTPELLEEVKGIAEGSGIDFPTMFAFQLIDEMWVLGRDVQSEHCTTIGVKKTDKNPSVVAQNLDIPRFYHGYQTLLHMKDSKTSWEALVFTIPGFIAANGLNNHSVAVVVNAVQQLENSRDGLPVAFVIRGILKKKSYEDAVQFIHTIKHGAPQNYMIGGPDNVGSFECSTNKAKRYIPFKSANFTYHTNHPLENLNYSKRFLDYLKSRNTPNQDYEYNCPRFKSLQKILNDNSVRIGINKLKKIFSDRETIINNRGTYGCTIMVLTENPELHISPGRPDEEPFAVFKFSSSIRR